MAEIVNHPTNSNVKLVSPAPGDGAAALNANFTYLGTVGNTVAAQPSTAQTLTNKTISGASNTITNIGNASLSSGIDAAKIGGGLVSNSEFGHLDGVSSNIQTQLNGKLATNGSIAASQVTSGIFSTARLGSGTPTTSTYLRGDGTWAAMSGGDVTSVNGQTGDVDLARQRPKRRLHPTGRSPQDREGAA